MIRPDISGWLEKKGGFVQFTPNVRFTSKMRVENRGILLNKNKNLCCSFTLVRLYLIGIQTHVHVVSVSNLSLSLNGNRAFNFVYVCHLRDRSLSIMMVWHSGVGFFFHVTSDGSGAPIVVPAIFCTRNFVIVRMGYNMLWCDWLIESRVPKRALS